MEEEEEEDPFADYDDDVQVQAVRGGGRNVGVCGIIVLLHIVLKLYYYYIIWYMILFNMVRWQKAVCTELLSKWLGELIII